MCYSLAIQGWNNCLASTIKSKDMYSTLPTSVYYKKETLVLILHVVNRFIDNEVGYSIRQLTFHIYAKIENHDL